MKAIVSVIVVVGTLFSFLSVTSGNGLNRLNILDSFNIKNDTSSSDSFGNYVIKKSVVPFYLEDLISNYALINPDELFKNISNNDCKGQTYQAILLAARILNTNGTTVDKDFMEKNIWALHLWDSWAKPPEGILTGHINAQGDYDECVGIRVKGETPTTNNPYKEWESDFATRYCNAYLLPLPDPFSPSAKANAKVETDAYNLDVMPRKSVTPEELGEYIQMRYGVVLTPSMGICFPSTCSLEDIQIILYNGFELFYAERNITYNDTKLVTWPVVSACYLGDKPPLDTADISMISILGLILFLCMTGTVVDVYLKRKEKSSKPGRPLQTILAFSMYTNVKKWLSTRTSPDDLGCLHGLRFLSTCWVVLAHTYYMVTFIPMWNMIDLKTVQEDWTIITILNATVSVDTFFVISGLLVGYNLLKVLHKSNGRINIPMFYLHRYLRLTPTYALLVGIMATLIPYLGSGPFWIIMERWSSFCETNWWTNLLYVNNFVNTSYLCQGEAWYLAIDFQCYIVSPILIYPLFKFEIVGIVLLVIWTILSCLCPALQVYFGETAPTTIGTRYVQDWFQDIYIKPYSRIQTYIIGIWLGYILFKTKGKKINLSTPVVTILWLLCTATSLAVLYGMYPYFDPLKPIPRVEGAIYAGLNRFAWGVCISWIIFACVKGYGGFINTFLSWKPFMPLGRLCFSVYLVSLHFQMILHLSFRQPLTFEPYSMTNFFFAHLVMSFLVGFVCTITMESPFIILEKLLFDGISGSPPPPPPKIQANDGENGNGQSKRYGIFYNNTDVILNGNDTTGAPTNEKVAQD